MGEINIANQRGGAIASPCGGGEGWGLEGGEVTMTASPLEKKTSITVSRREHGVLVNR